MRANEPPQSIWKKSWKGPASLVFLVVLLAVPTFFGVIFVFGLLGASLEVLGRVALLTLLVSTAVVIGALPLRRQLRRLFRWLFTWRILRRFLFGTACFTTLVALAYAVENWRGKRAWEKCKRDLEAKGEVLDWAAYIPAPIPDDQNIIKAPKMTEWFVKPRPGTAYTNAFSAKFSYQPLFDAARRDNPKSPVLVAQVAVVPVNSRASSDGQMVVRPDAPDAKERLGKIVQDAVGLSTEGVQGFFTLVQRQPSRIEPSRLLLETDKPLSLGDLSQLFPASLVSSKVGHLQVEAEAASGSFRIVLAAEPVVSAEDYLAMSDAGVPELDLIREALKRPRIRMDDDYQRPFEIPIVNFVNIRNVAQAVTQRAKCCLLLGQSERAFRELSLIFDLRRLLTSKPTWLVAAMIDVAVSGLYADTIAEGFRLQAWREPELAALQEQLQQINLLPAVAESFRMEPVAVRHTIETSSARELAKLFLLGRGDRFWERITNPTFLLLKLAPRGWLYQNLIASATVTATGSYDVERWLIKPGVAEAANRELERITAHRSPFTILAIITLPNYMRATQSMARNQTKANQTLIVCALERYRLAHGGYPESLDALVPQFIAKLPHDIIGGQPLKYRRADDGQFLLYSVGWNEKDDGGQIALTENGSVDAARGDWVWQYPVK